MKAILTLKPVKADRKMIFSNQGKLVSASSYRRDAHRSTNTSEYRILSSSDVIVEGDEVYNTAGFWSRTSTTGIPIGHPETYRVGNGYPFPAIYRRKVNMPTIEVIPIFSLKSTYSDEDGYRIDEFVRKGEVVLFYSNPWSSNPFWVDWMVGNETMSTRRSGEMLFDGETFKGVSGHLACPIVEGALKAYRKKPV